MKPSRWQNLNIDTDIDWSVPDGPGVYVFIGDGKLLYVGATDWLPGRLATYKIRYAYGTGVRCTFGAFQSLVVKCAVGGPFGLWWAREARLIRRLRPSHNTRGKNPVKGVLCG